MVVSWKQNPVVGVILVVVILIALIFIIKGMVPKKYYYTADLKCEGCEAIYKMKIAAGEKFPLKCKECGKKAAYRALQCMECGDIFIIKPIEFTKDRPMDMMEEMPKCPECGSYNIGSIKREPEESKED